MFDTLVNIPKGNSLDEAMEGAGEGNLNLNLDSQQKSGATLQEQLEEKVIQ